MNFELSWLYSAGEKGTIVPMNCTREPEGGNTKMISQLLLERRSCGQTSLKFACLCPVGLRHGLLGLAVCGVVKEEPFLDIGR